MTVHLNAPDDLDPAGEAASAVAIGMMLIDRDMKVVWANDYLRERCEELLKGEPRPCFQALWERSEQCADCLPNLLFQTGVAQEGLRERRRPGEPSEIYRVRAAPAIDKEGRLRWALESFVNLSSLGLSVMGGGGAQGRATPYRPGAACVVVSLDHRISSWSREAEEIFGYGMDEALGRSADLLFPRDRLAEMNCLMESVAREGKTPRMETVRRAKDGRHIPVAVSATALRNRAGELIGRYTFIEDLSALSRLRERLRTQEQLLAHLTRETADAVLELTLDGEVRSWSHGAEKVFGYSEKEVRGRSLGKLVEAESIKNLIRRVLRERTVRDFQMEWLDAEGGSLPVSVSATTLWDGGGKPRGVAALVRDVRAGRLLERRMRRSEKLAVVGSLAAGLAHEIGTPLNIISATAEYLLLDGGLEGEGRRELRGIVEETDRIGKLVKELLSFARESPEEREAIRPAEALSRILRVIRIPLERKGIRVDLDVPDDAPPVHLQPDGFRQLLLNLLLNAVNAVPEGGRVEVKVREAAAGEHGDGRTVALAICDDGPGVPRELRERIFDPFFTTRRDGTGLGLTVCARIVANHGGDIQVAGGPLGGACFTVHLPVAPETSFSGGEP